MPFTGRLDQSKAAITNGTKQMNSTKSLGKRGINPWRVAAWGMAALLLLLPALAMQFDSGVNWSVGDFIFVAMLIGIVGVTLELVVRATGNWAFRGGVLVALAASAAILVATGAVGMIGDEDSSYNLLFFAVIALALLGAVIARFRASGMVYAMAAAGIAQVGIALGGLSVDLRGAILSALLGGLWFVSAALFRVAAHDEAG